MRESVSFVTMETVKAIIAWAISPLIMAGILQICGWVFWFLGQRRLALTLLGSGFFILFVGSLPVVSFGKNRDQEYVYKPLDVEAGLDGDKPVLVVVLGTGFNPDPMLPANSQVSGVAHARLLEAVRIYRSRPDVRILVSVANESAGKKDKKEFLQEMVVLLGLDWNQVVLATDAESTSDEAGITSGVRKDGEQVVVATSARHMPRAMSVFDKAGFDPIAAPADFRSVSPGSPEDRVWQRWVPSTEGIGDTHQMLYENLAGLWHELGGS